ncbi:MAG: hypothetical protein LBC18_04175 [Opitutaceae bacterium]|jgi:hypothetical protein|nr:hypothetical protein [Opitutaceae bacterium]
MNNTTTKTKNRFRAIQGATGSDVTAGVFLFLLSSLSCQASRFARNSLLFPDERERENKKEGGITSCRTPNDASGAMAGKSMRPPKPVGS